MSKLTPCKIEKAELQALQELRQALQNVPEAFRTQEWRMLDYRTRFRIQDLKEIIYGPQNSAAA